MGRDCCGTLWKALPPAPGCISRGSEGGAATAVAPAGMPLSKNPFVYSHVLTITLQCCWKLPHQKSQKHLQHQGMHCNKTQDRYSYCPIIPASIRHNHDLQCSPALLCSMQMCSPEMMPQAVMDSDGRVENKVVLPLLVGNNSCS